MCKVGEKVGFFPSFLFVSSACACACVEGTGKDSMGRMEDPRQWIEWTDGMGMQWVKGQRAEKKD